MVDSNDFFNEGNAVIYSGDNQMHIVESTFVDGNGILHGYIYIPEFIGGSGGGMSFLVCADDCTPYPPEPKHEKYEIVSENSDIHWRNTPLGVKLNLNKEQSTALMHIWHKYHHCASYERVLYDPRIDAYDYLLRKGCVELVWLRDHTQHVKTQRESLRPTILGELLVSMMQRTHNINIEAPGEYK